MIEKTKEFELDDEGKSYVQVDDDMRLIMSPRNWQLQKKIIAQSDTKNQKKGDETWISFKYFLTLESALNTIVHIKTAKEFFNDARTMQEANKKVINEIVKAFSPVYEIKKVA
jgi:hypothetical protein